MIHKTKKFCAATECGAYNPNPRIRGNPRNPWFKRHSRQLVWPWQLRSVFAITFSFEIRENLRNLRLKIRCYFPPATFPSLRLFNERTNKKLKGGNNG